MAAGGVLCVLRTRTRDCFCQMDGDHQQSCVAEILLQNSKLLYLFELQVSSHSLLSPEETCMLDLKSYFDIL